MPLHDCRLTEVVPHPTIKHAKSISTMSNELPATNWLGYSLDMLQATPLDIKSVCTSITFIPEYCVLMTSLQVTESVKKARRIILYYPDEDTRPVKIGE